MKKRAISALTAVITISAQKQPVLKLQVYGVVQRKHSAHGIASNERNVSDDVLAL